MFDQLSIRHKLVILLGLSSALGLVASALMMIHITYLSERETSLRNLHQMAAILSENMQAALAFHDEHSANNLLVTLHTNPHILYAAVELENGDSLAEYQRYGASEKLLAASRATISSLHQEAHRSQWMATDGMQHMDKEFHAVLHPINFYDEHLGILTIVSGNQAMLETINRFVILQALAALLILFILILLSLRLQHLFTQPIYELIATMREVATSKNYTVQISSSRTDEFQMLYQDFNSMLEEIRVRDKKLSQLATTDSLTGLPNRHHALETYEWMARRAQRKGEPIGMIMLDIDHFKYINDTYGHPAGDCVLQQLAGILLNHAREYDLSARFGGEEFLVLCDNADLQVTHEIAERIRKAAAAHDFRHCLGDEKQITISLGFHSAIPENEDPATMIALTDQALYRAKQAGRNRTESSV